MASMHSSVTLCGFEIPLEILQHSLGERSLYSAVLMLSFLSLTSMQEIAGTLEDVFVLRVAVVSKTMLLLVDAVRKSPKNCILPPQALR
eukprot:268272-Rhodomonas_salina.3